MGIIKEFNIDCDKKYGQCFLVDNDALDKISALADIKKNDLVIEIGSGPANLTSRLAAAASHVIAFETDRNLFKIYDKYFKGSNATFYQMDFLKADPAALIGELKTSAGLSFNRIKVVSNIPYYITSQIIEKLLYSKIEFIDIYLLIQSDVASRIAAEPGSKDYSILSVACALKSKVSILEKIARTCFHPAPEVESVLVRLEPVKRSMAEGFKEDIFFAVVKSAFNQRRKVAVSAIANNIERVSGINGYDERFVFFLKKAGLKSVFGGIFEKAGIPLLARAQDISCGDYIVTACQLGRMFEQSLIEQGL
jgi:16S rRNA (adenine1518-N6/adenine1519-N6)-dimethyltransferase